MECKFKQRLEVVKTEPGIREVGLESENELKRGRQKRETKLCLWWRATLSTVLTCGNIGLLTDCKLRDFCGRGRLLVGGC